VALEEMQPRRGTKDTKKRHEEIPEAEGMSWPINFYAIIGTEIDNLSLHFFVPLVAFVVAFLLAFRGSS
jgi:hypothetical protein